MNMQVVALDPTAVRPIEYSTKHTSFSFELVRTMRRNEDGTVTFKLADSTILHTNMDEPEFWAAAASMMHPSLVNVRAGIDHFGVCIRAVCYDGDAPAVAARLARFVEAFAGRERIRFRVV